MPFGAATYFTETFRKFNDRSPVRKVLCFFLPIFAGRDGEGNEQKFGEEGDQAKQWSLCFEKSVSTRQVLVGHNAKLFPPNSKLVRNACLVLLVVVDVLSVLGVAAARTGIARVLHQQLVTSGQFSGLQK